MTEKEIRIFLRSERYEVEASLFSSNEDEDNRTLQNVLPATETAFENFELRETLEKAMEDFSPAEKRLVQYRFFEGLSQTETAKRMGVSQMFISRSERKVLKKLYERLNGNV